MAFCEPKLYKNISGINQQKTITTKTTFNNGYLGSPIDEEHGKM